MPLRIPGGLVKTHQQASALELLIGRGARHLHSPRPVPRGHCCSRRLIRKLHSAGLFCVLLLIWVKTENVFLPTDYEEIGTSLFDCKLFEDTFVNFQAAIQKKIHQYEERQQQLKEEIEVLQDLNQTMYSLQEDRDVRSSSTSVSSVSSKDYHFLNQE
uniref:Uncharacterized protein n=1 Tax=Ursus americanus TaxID=9643 RepID=A0A452QVA3_URSAM